MQRAAQTGDGENGEEFNLSLLISVPSPLGAAVMEMPGGAKIESGLRGSLAEGGQRRERCEAPAAALASNKKVEAGTRGLLLWEGCNFVKVGAERQFAWWLRSRRAAAAAAARSH